MVHPCEYPRVALADFFFFFDYQNGPKWAVSYVRAIARRAFPRNCMSFSGFSILTTKLTMFKSAFVEKYGQDTADAKFKEHW